MVLFSLVVIILVATIRVVDKTPYFKTEYYNETFDSFNEILANNTEGTGQLEAGFGVVNITPNIISGEENPLEGKFKKVPLAGFGDRKTPATGVHDSIFVKAAALKVGNKTVLTISADLLLIPPQVADSVAFLLKKNAGISREQLFFGATHTHSSIGGMTPGIIGEMFSGEFQPGIITFLYHKFTDAAIHALTDLKPATFNSFEINAPELVRNRMNGEKGRLNDKFSGLQIQQINGRKAVIGAFAAHSTTLGDSNMEFSGDFPGYWQRKIEEEFADVAIYFAGTLGSHSHKGIGDGFDKPKYMGEELAKKLIESNEMQVNDSASLSFFSFPLKTSRMQFRVTKNLFLAPFVSDKMLPQADSCYIQGMRLGDLIWVTAPLELSGEIALDVKNALKHAGYNSMFTSFNGAYLGYVTPSKYYYDKTYESYLMGWFGPSMGDYVSDLLFKTSNNLAGKRL